MNELLKTFCFAVAEE